MLNLGTLIAHLQAEATQYFKALEQAEAAFAPIQRAADVASAAISAAFVGAAGAGLQFAGTLEQLDIGFTTMLGSAALANDMMGELQALAAQSPFSFESAATGAKRLIAMGVAADQVVPLMRDVGDAVAAMGGGSAEIGRVTKALGQMVAKGKVQAEEMNQLAENGISGWKMLSDYLNTDVSTAMKMVTARAVDAQTMLAAFSAGVAANFGGMMEKQAQTLSGRLSALQDEVRYALAGAVEPLLQPLKEAIPVVSQMIQDIVAASGPVVALLADMTREATAMAAAFSAMGPTAQQSVLAISAAAVALPAVGGAMLSIAGAVGQLLTGLGAIGTALSGAFSSGVLLAGAAALGTVAAAVMLIQSRFDELSDAASAFYTGFTANFRGAQKVVDVLVGSFSDLLSIASQTLGLLLQGMDWGDWYGLGTALAKIGNFLGGIVANGLKTAANLIKSLYGIFQPVIVSLGQMSEGLMGLITGSKSAGEAFAQMGRGIIGMVASVASSAVTILLTAVGEVSGILGTMVSVIPGAQGAAMERILMDLSDGMAATVASIGGRLSSAIAGAPPKSTSSFDEWVGGPSIGKTADRPSVTGYVPPTPSSPSSGSGGTGKAASEPEWWGAMATWADGALSQLAALDFSTLSSEMDAALVVFDAWITGLENWAWDEIVFKPLRELSASFDETFAPLQAGLDEMSALVDAYVAFYEGLGGLGDAFINLQHIFSGGATSVGDFLSSFGSAAVGLVQGIFAGSSAGSVIDTAIQGASVAGPWGAIAGATVGLLQQSGQMQATIDGINEAMAGIAGALGTLIGAAQPLIGAVLMVVQSVVTAIQPAFQIIGEVFAGFAPALFAISVAFDAIGVLFSTFADILNMTMGPLGFAFEVLFVVFKAIALTIMGAVYVIGSVINVIVGAIAAVSDALGFDKAADNLRSMMVDTKSVSDSMSELWTTTYDSAMAQADQAVAVDEATEAMKTFSEELLNVPQGFKVALYRFESTAADVAAALADIVFSGDANGGDSYASGEAFKGDSGINTSPEVRSRSASGASRSRGGGGNVYHIGAITVVANDPDDMLRQIEGRLARRTRQRTGRPLPAGSPFSSGR